MPIALVPYDPRFLERLYEWRGDPAMKKYNPVEPLPIESLRERMLKARSDFADFERAEFFFWFIECDGLPIGNVSLRNINRMMQTAEIGYAIESSARGKGYATAAVCQVTENVFKRTPLRKLIAYVHEDNLASRRVLEKAGYKQEGLLREHYIVDGSPANEIIYGILRRDLRIES